MLPYEKFGIPEVLRAFSADLSIPQTVWQIILQMGDIFARDSGAQSWCSSSAPRMSAE